MVALAYHARNSIPIMSPKAIEFRKHRLHPKLSRAIPRMTAMNLFKSTFLSKPQGSHVQSIRLLSDEEIGEDQSQPEETPSKLSTWIRQIQHTIYAIFMALLPSFIAQFFKSDRTPRKLHPTSFLDGLRGCAAFIVSYFHFIGATERWLLPSYGLNGDEMGSNFLQLPFIRVLFNGRVMVHIFMVISGYVLSCKAIKLVRSNRQSEADDVVISLIFRRPLRLFLPCIAGLVLVDAEAWLGWQNWQAPDTIWGKIMNIGTNAAHLIWSWDWDREYSWLLNQLWTIPVEFACSMMLFVVLLGTSRLRSGIRIGLVTMLAIYSHACMHWCPFEFMAGMLIAEVELVIAERSRNMGPQIEAASLEKQTRAKSAATILYNSFWTTIFIAALFLAGYPQENADISWGFSYIVPFTPRIYLEAGDVLPSYFWFSISAVMIVVSLFRVPFLRKPFETGFAQYLGDVSYSVYIVHYSKVLMLTNWITGKAHAIVGETDWQIKRDFVVILEVIMLMVVVIWQADLFWRFVDKPTVAFARRAEKFCRRPSSDL